MKRALILAAVMAPALAAASGPLAPRETVGQALARTAAEANAAAAEVARLEARERAASGMAARFAAQRQRAAADISLTEARIAAADLSLTAARNAVRLREVSLARERAPLAALLAGLATMGRRPPILALADGTSIAEIVRVRALIDVSMPMIAARSASLQRSLGEGRRLADRATEARRAVLASRALLIDQQRSFAALEAKASKRAAMLRASASASEDQVLAGGEAVLDLGGEAARAAEARAAARALAAYPLAAPRPTAPDSAPPRSPIAYALPTSSPVIEGLGDVSAAGVRSRGIRFATPRGSPITVPAAGTILFASAFRDYDGIVVIDHGNGWTSLLTNVAPIVRRGDVVGAGSPLGRALGDVGLELRHGGEPRSAALIAGSSGLLSNIAKTR